MAETAMAAALRKAGAPVDESRLFARGSEILRKHGTTEFAARMLAGELSKDDGLRFAAAMVFLRRLDEDRERMAAKELPGEGQHRVDAHVGSAQVRQPAPSDGGGGPSGLLSRLDDTQGLNARRTKPPPV